jgi:Ca-activated chloride channel homolog
MNPDDPKWTAYALDELEGVERAQLDREVERQVSIQMELDRTRAFADRLRSDFLRSPSAGLKEEQRRAIFEAQRRCGAGGPAKRGVFWRQPGAVSAMAASLVVGAGLAFFLAFAFNAQRDAVRKASANMPVSADGMRIALVPMTASESEQRAELLGPASPDSSGPDGVGNGLAGSNQKPSSVITAPKSGGDSPLFAPWKPREDGYAWFWNRQALQGAEVASVPTADRRDSANMARWNPPPSGRSPAVRSIGASSGGRLVHSAALPNPSARSAMEPAFRGDSRAGGARSVFPSDNPFLRVSDQPVSVVSALSGSSGLRGVREYLSRAQVPPSSEVRIEEILQGFEYEFPGKSRAQAGSDAEISGVLEAGACPWARDHRLVRLAFSVDPTQEPSPSGVHLGVVIDGVPARRMSLLRKGIQALIEAMGEDDQIALVTAGRQPVVLLEPTRNKKRVLAELDRLERAPSGGSAEAVLTTMALVEKHFLKGGLNRVILAAGSDSDWSVKSEEALHSFIGAKPSKEIGLSVLALDCDRRFAADRLRLAEAGHGNFSEGASVSEVRAMFRRETRPKPTAYAREANFQVEFNPLHVAAYRLIGYEGAASGYEGAESAGRGGQAPSGQSWTVLYEVVPVSKLGLSAAGGTGLKYQPSELALLRGTLPQGAQKELLTVKVAAKLHGVPTPVAKEFVLTEASAGKESIDFRFASAVAAFGMMLRDSPYRGTADWAMVLKLASESRITDRDGARAEFVELVEQAKLLWR